MKREVKNSYVKRSGPIVITADEQDEIGGCHNYLIEVNTGDHPEFPMKIGSQIHFQEGPLLQTSPNGVSMESLIAVCIDRLEGYQSGKFSCRENACAKTHLEEALHWLHSRTIAREDRNVEGKLVV